MLEGDSFSGYNSSQFNEWVVNRLDFKANLITELRKQRFIVNHKQSGGARVLISIRLHEPSVKHLRELLW